MLSEDIPYSDVHGNFTLARSWVTLRGENRVVYRTVVDIGGAAKNIAPEPHYFGSGTAERSMIQNVKVDYIR